MVSPHETGNNIMTRAAKVGLMGVMCVSGVYFFHIGVITAGVLYNLSLGAGVGNAMLPKLKNKSVSKI